MKISLKCRSNCDGLLVCISFLYFFVEVKVQAATLVDETRTYTESVYRDEKNR